MARMKLEELVTQLQKIYGADLRAVVLYGSAATGEYIEGRSDQNVLVLVDSIDLERLRDAAAVASAWAEAGNPPPLMLTSEEWRGSADIFPMEVADVLEGHRVLHGALPLDGVAVDREHLRLQVEQQTLGKLLRLRQAVLAAGADSRRLLELLESSLSTFMVIFRGVTRLHGEQPSVDYETLSRRVAGWGEFDPEPFVMVVRHLRGESKLERAEAPGVLAAYLAALRRLVAHLDSFRHEAG